MVFSGNWQKVGRDTWEADAAGAFQLYVMPQLICANCTGMAGEDMNKIIDVLLEFNCPLYDPQVGKRFDGG